MKTAWIVLGCLASSASVASAQNDDRAPSRLRYIEGDVALQRASDTSSEEARTNMPFLPGDRLWTQSSGRVELQFTDGSVLHLDSRTKLDYENIEGDRVVLKLWSGGAILRRYDRGALDFTISTPDGIADMERAGRYRLEVDSAETRFDVLEGKATFDAQGRRVTLNGGEQIVAREGDLGDVGVASAEGEFDYWSDDRDRTFVADGPSDEYLPEEVQPYRDDFDNYGSWTYVDAEIGHAWRPRVDISWTPYNDGGWFWTDYGWTWVPNEPWGWAACHYGRWGHSTGLGWYWIPGRRWSPAWVSWAVSDYYVGWAPLGHRDRALNIDIDARRRGIRGHAVPRSTWTYASRNDLGRRAGGRAMWTRPKNVADLKVIESPSVRLTKNFQTTQATGRAVGRWNRGPGDVVRELRDDPKYLHAPDPQARRGARPRDAAEVERHQRSRPGNGAVAVPEQRSVEQRALPRSSEPREVRQHSTPRVWRTRPTTPQTSETEPREIRAPRELRREVRPRETEPREVKPREVVPRVIQRPPVRTPRDFEERRSVVRPAPERSEVRAQEPVRESPSREVIRRFFRPAEEGWAKRARPAPEVRELRSAPEPRHVEPQVRSHRQERRPDPPKVERQERRPDPPPKSDRPEARRARPRDNN